MQATLCVRVCMGVSILGGNVHRVHEIFKGAHNPKRIWSTGSGDMIKT